MNTNNRWMKALSIFIILTFFFQGIPVYAAGQDPPELKMGELETQHWVSLDQANQNTSDPTVPVDPTTRHYLGSPLLTTDKVEETDYTKIYPIKPVYYKYPYKLIINDLINTFGFEFEQLMGLIRNGSIRFEWTSPESVRVIIDPSVELPPGAINLTDPLGSNNLPNEITYQFIVGPDLIVCLEGAVCNPRTYYQLVSANFINDKGQIVEIGYQNNLIDNVKIYELLLQGDANGDGVVDATDYVIWRKNLGQTGDNLPGDFNHDGKVDTADMMILRDNFGKKAEKVLVKEIRYSHGEPGEFKTFITYHDGSQGEVASRAVYLDDSRIIREVTEYDKDGKVMARSIWVGYEYRACEPGQNCVMYYPPYFEPYIRREDADGNLLSIVRVSDLFLEDPRKPLLWFEGEVKLVTITLPDGTVVSQKFIDPTIEDILNFARRVEQENGLEKLRQEILDKVDSMVREIEVEIAVLQVKLEKIVSGIKEDASYLTQAIRDVMGSLEAIMDEKGLSDETRQMIQEYLDLMTKYLDPENEESFQHFVDLFIEDQYFWIGHVKIDSRRDYLKELDFYREAVQNAKTKEELEKLAQNFPRFMEPVYKRREVADPRPEARKYLAGGEALLAKAKEEIFGFDKSHIKPWEFHQVLPDFGSGIGHGVIETAAEPKVKETLVGETLKKPKERPIRPRPVQIIKKKRNPSNVKPLVPAITTAKPAKPETGASMFASYELLKN